MEGRQGWETSAGRADESRHTGTHPARLSAARGTRWAWHVRAAAEEQSERQESASASLTTASRRKNGQLPGVGAPGSPQWEGCKKLPKPCWHH